MATWEYQNIFTQTQVRGHPEMGPPMVDSTFDRLGRPGFSWWVGKFGNAQIGPIYLGGIGLASIVSGVLAIVIIFAVMKNLGLK